MPVAGDRPAAVEKRGTTVNEAREGESLGERLAAEEPEAGEPADDLPEERTGLLYDVPDPDRPREQDMYSEEDSTRGLSAEEDAVHVKREP